MQPGAFAGLLLDAEQQRGFEVVPLMVLLQQFPGLMQLSTPSVLLAVLPVPSLHHT